MWHYAKWDRVEFSTSTDSNGNSQLDQWVIQKADHGRPLVIAAEKAGENLVVSLSAVTRRLPASVKEAAAHYEKQLEDALETEDETIERLR